MRIGLAVCLVFLIGCSRYADFTLPVLAGSARKGHVRMERSPFASHPSRFRLGSRRRAEPIGRP